MRLKEVSPKIAVKELIKLRPERSQIDVFKANMLRLLGKIDEIEREENQKNHIRDFLLDTFYKETNEINTKDSKDLVIHLGKSNKDKVGVIIETKRPSNKSEMLSIENPNTKALHELVLYYMRERFDEKNIDIKNIVATNIYEWFIIDAQYFEKHFARNKSFVKDYNDWKDKLKVASDTSLFYNEIVKPYIDSIEDEIPVVRFDIRDYKKSLKDSNKLEDKRLIALYKTQSPYHLLRAQAPDSNTLNDKFYKELLYIIGLEEVKDGGKIIIRRKKENRNAGSLLENAIAILETEDLYRVKDYNQYGADKEERIFSIALELALTWINRILFLKLLEGQLITYHRGDTGFRFLNSDTIHDFDELFKLFHNVLARKTEERAENVKAKYHYVPYLNSSLFEFSELEAQTIKINSLDNRAHLDLMSNSVLRDKTRKNETLFTLDYIFRFLEAYDFSTEGNDEIQETNKSLINASVLGKVFEKINGYRDGSIYTPAFITMYMCRETIRLAVVQKFNERYNWECKEVKDVYNKIDNIKEANEIVNSLKICDPAVGSGHFLVSALNEIITIKAELGILQDENGKRIKDYSIEIINDELIIIDEYNDPFIYNPQNKESQRIQKTLFQEKQTIIENCLFGVDINQNSVKICRLRLWIELLKNAYYKEEGGYTELETLPNIDINIKCGNSLISRYALDSDLKSALKSTGNTIPEYRDAVYNFKNATDREEKRHLISLIESIKNGFQIYFSIHDERREKLSKARGELVKLQSDSLFETKKADADNKKKIDSLKKRIDRLEKEIDEIKNNIVYQNAFEWRFEFPEVLDNEGNFAGFDMLIGNPPYIQLQKMGAIADCLQDEGYHTFARTGDIYCLFYEQGIRLLKPNGYLCFITSNKWMRAVYGEALRNYFLSYANPLQLIDFAGLQLFDAATVDTNILLLEKSPNKNALRVCALDKNIDSLKNLSVFVSQNASKTEFKLNDSWVILSSIEKRIKTKIESIGTPLKDWNINIYRGVLTGYNDAFVIDDNKRKDLIAADPKSAEIIRPILRGRDIKRLGHEFANLWLIYVPWHFPLHKDNSITGSSLRAEDAFRIEYPAIYDHLLSYKEELSNRNKAETGIRYEWYALQRWGANYWEDFFKPKIIYPGIMRIAKSNSNNFPRFTLDNAGNFFFGNDCYFIVGEHLNYLWIFLNSTLMGYLFRYYIYSFDETGFKMFTEYFQHIPIPLPNEENQSMVNHFLQQEVKMTDVNTWIYNLIGLNEDEINEIEGSVEKIISQTR